MSTWKSALILAALVALPRLAWATDDWTKVAEVNCGLEGVQPYLIAGMDSTYPLEDIPADQVAADSPARTVAYGDEVVLEFHGLVAGAKYRLHLTFLSDSDRRVQRVSAGGVTLIDQLALPKGEVLEKRLAVPAEAIVDGILSLKVARLAGPNAVVSTVELWSDDPTPVKPPPLPQARMPRLSPRPVAVGGVKTPCISLNGTWRFNAAPPAGFAELHEVSGWPEIEVSGEWVMQAFRVEPETAAGYWRAFDVPADWAGRRIKLRFDGVGSECTVWVNGRKAGGHLGGFTPFELDVTDAARPGRNTLALAVISESLADVLASASQYAVHPLGGIPRRVTVFAVPKLNLAALIVTTTFDRDYCDATLGIELQVVHEGDHDVDDATVRLALVDPDGRPISIEPAIVKLPKIQAGDVLTHAVKVPVPRPLKWDTEHPNLYRLECTLHAPGEPPLTVARRVGFRQIEVRGNRVLVNNRPIKLRGVNRHEVHPLRGRSLTPELWRKDAELFREANVNYIRTSHYPPAEEFLDACDDLGLFVECEAPLCWVQHGANPNWRKPDWNYRDPRLFEPLAQANLENLAANRHHPSIIIWSLANESRWSRLFARVLELVQAADPTRLTSFHDQCWGGYNNAGSTAQIANFHYPGPDGPAKAAHSQRPLLFGEYCHLNTYNRYEIVTDPGIRDAWGLALASMWPAMCEADGCLGGAIWSGIDDVFFRPDGQAVGYGTWGPIDGWRRPKPEYWHVKKVYSPIRVLERCLPLPAAGQPICLNVVNRYDFTNLREVRIDWSLGRQSGLVKADIAPHSTGEISIAPHAPPGHGDVLELTFTDPRGFVAEQVRLAFGQTCAPRESACRPAPQAIRIERSDEAYAVRGQAFSHEIDRRTGQLIRARIGGRDVLIGGPELLLLPLNGAGDTQMTGRRETYAPYTHTGAGWVAEQVNLTGSAEAAIVEVIGHYEEAAGSYTMEVGPQGGLTISYQFVVSADINPRQIGLVFDLPLQFDTLSWERNALWSVYPDDHIGRPSGTATAFVGGNRSGPAGPAEQPDAPWACDWNELGTNDFRATRMNILQAALTAKGGCGIRVLSDGSQHVRAWVDGPRVRLLVADYSNLGAEPFLRAHARRFERPLQAGDAIEGIVRLELVMPPAP